MTIRQVFYRLKAQNQKELKQEIRDRRQVFWLAKINGVKLKSGVPLMNPWDIWEIPEVDKEAKKQVKTSRVRKATAEEWRLVKEKPEGWITRIREIQQEEREKRGWQTISHQDSKK